MNIKWPATSKTQENVEYVKVVMNKLGSILGNPKLENSWISDMACVGDYISFNFKDLDSIINKLSQEFGFHVKLNDKIYEIAVKLKQKE